MALSPHHDEPRTLQEMHARAMAARRRMEEAARLHARARTIAEKKPFELVVSVDPAKPVAVVPQRDDLIAKLVERAEELAAEHAGSWTGRDLMIIVAGAAHILPDDIRSQARTMKLVRPRQVFFWLARRFTALSLPQIGGLAGGRDHTTALYAIEKVDHVIAYLGQAEQDAPAVWAAHLLSKPWPSGWRAAA